MTGSGHSTTLEAFAGATTVTVNKSQFSSVGGNQYNYHTTHQHIAQTREKREFSKDLPRLSEFNEIKQGNIIKNKDICDPWQLRLIKKDDTEVAVYHAEINIVGSFGQKRFTVKAYHGRNAKKEWRRDFLKCSKDWRRDVPLFGYNKSSVPLLILHGELVPVAQIQDRLGGLGKLYIDMLRGTWGCPRNHLWMDPTKGRFCLGPAGPNCLGWLGDYGNVTVPSGVEFLEEDVLFQYFSGIKHDWGLLLAVAYSSHFERTEDIYSATYTQVISGSTNSTIAYIRDVQWTSWIGCLTKKDKMSDGATRFCLREGQHYIEVGSQMQDCAWLSQSFSVFHALNIQLNEDLSEYKLIIPYFGLRGRLQRSAQKRQRRQLFAPIYFFVKPCPSPGARFYFWSHDPFGQIPLSRSGCKYLGLPFKLSLKVQYYLESWPTRIYKFLHDYQIERGYDPRTTDFAQSHGYPTWEVTPSENRFQEVDQELHTNISKSESLPSPRIEHVQGHSESEVNVGLPHSRDTSNVRVEASTSLISDSTSSLNPAKFAANPASTQSVGTVQSLLGALFSTFTLSAIEDSGIPASVI